MGKTNWSTTDNICSHCHYLTGGLWCRVSVGLMKGMQEKGLLCECKLISSFEVSLLVKRSARMTLKCKFLGCFFCMA